MGARQVLGRSRGTAGRSQARAGARTRSRAANGIPSRRAGRQSSGGASASRRGCTGRDTCCPSAPSPAPARTGRGPPAPRRGRGRNPADLSAPEPRQTPPCLRRARRAGAVGGARVSSAGGAARGVRHAGARASPAARGAPRGCEACPHASRSRPPPAAARWRCDGAAPRVSNEVASRPVARRRCSRGGAAVRLPPRPRAHAGARRGLLAAGVRRGGRRSTGARLRGGPRPPRQAAAPFEAPKKDGRGAAFTRRGRPRPARAAAPALLGLSREV
jgi:hypothetical protein